MSKMIIVAVSGGPDSMALLDIMRKDGYDCIVAHVNYGQRVSAIRDQKIVETYCDKHNFKFELLKVKKVKAGNFQAFARETRYDFLIELSNKYQIHDVYVAHHQDDVLETFIMQKMRNITPQYYGIKDKLQYKSINIIRPLLNCSKQDLINYCLKNVIEYGVDETNLVDDYKRNKIRHEIVNKMSQTEKTLMLEEINQKNIELHEKQVKIGDLYNQFTTHYQIEFILKQNKEQAADVIRLWFKQHKIYNISDDEYANILEFIQSKNNGEYYVNANYSLFKDYSKLTLASNLTYQYSYHLNEIKFGDFKHFKIKESGSNFEAVTVSKNDFPITIRNFHKGDKIAMRYGNKRVSRWFIDNKIEPSIRRSWPIVLNSSDEVILVPGIGCNVTHFSNNPNLFVVK